MKIFKSVLFIMEHLDLTTSVRGSDKYEKHLKFEFEEVVWYFTMN